MSDLEPWAIDANEMSSKGEHARAAELWLRVAQDHFNYFKMGHVSVRRGFLNKALNSARRAAQSAELFYEQIQVIAEAERDADNERDDT